MSAGRVKQSAIYQDDWLTSISDDFAEEHVVSVFHIAEDARDVINDGHIRRAGRVFYQTTLVGGQSALSSPLKG